MIRISISEAEAFDRLSILLVKESALGLGSGDSDALADEMSCISDFQEAKNSTEFKILHHQNAIIFQLVEDAKKDLVKASVVAEANHRRYLSKKRLQERFWPMSELNEIKS